MAGKGRKAGEISKNTLYTILGALVLNGVLQLIIYPRLTAGLGAEQMGGVHFIMGIVGVLGPSVGQALNTGRLVLRRDHDVSNGDYALAVLIFTAIATIAVLPYVISVSGKAILIPCAILIFLTVYRFYGDVEYRLSLKYERYFVYYLLASIGYLAGYFLYVKGGSWYWIFLIGEAAAIIYVALTGSIFKGFFRRSEFFPLVMKKGSLLVGSYLITNITLNLDRLILKALIGGEAVTIYYVTSLIGKTLVLLVAPLNTILISYLTKDKVRFDRRQFLKFSGIGIGVSAVFFLLCQIGTPLYVRLFYPSLAETTAPLVTIVNLSQVLAVLSAYLFMIVLTFTEERWQLILQAGHLALLIILVAVMTPGSGLLGFSAAVLIANTIRIVAVLALGLIGSGKKAA